MAHLYSQILNPSLLSRVNWIRSLLLLSIVVFTSFTVVFTGRSDEPANAQANQWNSIGPEGGWIFTVIIDPKDSSFVFAAGPFGIFKSDDGGASWSMANKGLYRSGISAFVIDTQTPSTLYAATDEGVFRSNNSGDKWEIIGSNNVRLKHVDALAVDPNNSSILYAASAFGLLKSENGGKDWKVSGLENSTAEVISIDPAVSKTIYAGTSAGVFKSLDGGTSWSKVDGTLATPEYSCPYFACEFLPLIRGG